MSTDVLLSSTGHVCICEMCSDCVGSGASYSPGRYNAAEVVAPGIETE